MLHVLLYFFLGYCSFEIPSNLILKSINPGTWFSRIMITWGFVSMMQAWVTNYTGLMICRTFLGVCEAGFFPGIAYYLTLWFNRRERASKLSYIIAMQCVAGMFGGLFAYAILQLEGKIPIHGWSLLFIVEGVPTILVGVLAYFTVTNSPDTAEWLTIEEREFIKLRVKAPPRKPITLKDVINGIINPQVLMFGLMYFCFHNCSYGLSFYNVPIINNFVKDPLTANALSIPLYAVALIVVVTISQLADRSRSYCFYLTLAGSMSALGYLLMGIALNRTNDFGFGYFSMILANAGSSSIIPNLVGWMTSSVVGSTETAAGIAFIVSFGNSAGTTAPYILSRSTEQTGTYGTGAYEIMALTILGIIVTQILEYYYPFSRIVQQAEQQDSRIGYGNTAKSESSIELETR